MQRRRQLYLAVAAAAGLFGVSACALFGGNTSNPPPVVNPGTETPAAQYGSILVQLNMPARQVQTVADVIETIELSLTGAKIPSAISATITKAQMAGGSASATLSQVPPGDHTLAAYVKDSAGNVIASSNAAVSVIAGKQATANLEIQIPLYGSVSTSITITGSGVASGSVVVPHEAFPAVEGSYGVLQANSKFAGATSCKACHPAQFNAFKTTAHWNPREATGIRPGTDIENFSGFVDKLYSGSPYLAARGGSCRSCHVVGDGSKYNATTKVTDQKSIFLNDGVTPAGFDFAQAWNSEYNKKFVGIQCESCHGPGENHVNAANLIDRKNSIVKVPSFKKTCNTCHNAYPGREWLATGATDTDVNTGTAGRTLLLGDTSGVQYGKTIPKSAHTTKLGNGCVNCHAAGQAPTSHKLYLKEKWTAALPNCQVCHGDTFSEEAVTAYQAQIKLGVDGVKKMMTEYQKALCAKVTVGTALTVSTASADLANTANKCAEWDDSPATVKSAILATGSAITSDPTTWSAHQTAFNRAAWNKSLIEKDASWGVHSPIYQQSLIRLSYNDLLKDLPSSASYTVLGLKK